MPEEGQAQALVDAAGESRFFSIVLQTQNATALTPVTQAAIIPGTDPTVNTAAYTAAYEVLESYRWNVLSIDTNDTAIHMMTQMYLNRIFLSGKLVMGTIGELATGTSGVSYDDRLTHASAYNDYQIVYVGNGYVDMTGTICEGWLAAARVAGMIAGTPSNQAVTRLPVQNAIQITEHLTNWQIEDALKGGMFVFTTSSADTVWIEQGINTLVLPDGNQDEGWKKIKRTKIRFELFDRIKRTIDPLIGRIDNDDDGRMTIIQLVNGVCNDMIGEKKLLPGARSIIDPNNTPRGDSAWFLILPDDVDSLEKAYLGFGFRFAPDVA